MTLDHIWELIYLERSDKMYIKLFKLNSVKNIDKLIVLIIIQFNVQCLLFAQEYSTNEVNEIPSIYVEPYERNSPAEDCAFDSKDEWHVILINDILSIEPDDYRYYYDSLPFEIKETDAVDGLSGARKTIEVNNGWIVSYDAGEFGGGLWWFSSDGLKKKHLAYEKVTAFFKTYLGLIGIGRKNILLLNQDINQEWFSENFLSFRGSETCPAVAETDSTILIVKNLSLIRVYLSKKYEIIHRNITWGGLYPNSIVIKSNGEIYIGMRHAVSCLYPSEEGYTEKWLVNKSCSQFNPKKE